jgi:hypothetical protein
VHPTDNMDSGQDTAGLAFPYGHRNWARAWTTIQA